MASRQVVSPGESPLYFIGELDVGLAAGWADVAAICGWLLLDGGSTDVALQVGVDWLSDPCVLLGADGSMAEDKDVGVSFGIGHARNRYPKRQEKKSGTGKKANKTRKMRKIQKQS